MDTFKRVKQIAEANKEGFTVSILDFTFPSKGFVIVMNLTQDHFGDEGLEKVIEIAQNSTFLVGGWFDYKEKVFHYDCSMIVEDLETALKLGKANEQKAIFDLNNLEEIRI